MKIGNELVLSNDDMNSGNNELGMKGGNGLTILDGGSTTIVTGGNDMNQLKLVKMVCPPVTYEDYDDGWSHIIDTSPETHGY